MFTTLNQVVQITQAKLCFANTSENTTKKQLFKVKKQNNGNKPGISLKNSIIRQIRTSNLEIKDLTPFTSQLRTLNNWQKLATNKADNICYEISNATDRDYSKKKHQISTFICKFGCEKKKLHINTLRSQA